MYKSCFSEKRLPRESLAREADCLATRFLRKKIKLEFQRQRDDLKNNQGRNRLATESSKIETGNGGSSMHDLIVFFDEAFSKVSGQDGGRTEVTRDGSSALGQERVAPAFERGGGAGRRSHRRVAELATEVSLPPLSPPLPLHRSATPTAMEPLHRGIAVDRLPRLLAASVEPRAPPLPLCDAGDRRI
jgi:hypothetical protein